MPEQVHFHEHGSAPGLHRRGNIFEPPCIRFLIPFNITLFLSLPGYELYSPDSQEIADLPVLCQETDYCAAKNPRALVLQPVSGTRDPDESCSGDSFS